MTWILPLRFKQTLVYRKPKHLLEVTEGSVGCHKIRMGILAQLILNLSSKESRLCGAHKEVGQIVDDK